MKLVKMQVVDMQQDKKETMVKKLEEHGQFICI
jgi:hypothetical protein